MQNQYSKVLMVRQSNTWYQLCYAFKTIFICNEMSFIIVFLDMQSLVFLSIPKSHVQYS